MSALEKLSMMFNNFIIIVISNMNGKKAQIVLDLPQAPTTKNVAKWVTTRLKKIFTLKTLRKRVPIFDYLPKYTFATALSDFLAGITVGLTIIPQAIAYSSVADLLLILFTCAEGVKKSCLYSSFVAPFTYAFFGSSKDSPVGPTAIEGLLTRESTHELGVAGAVLLCFLSGCVEFSMGVLNLGFLIDFISAPVAVAFTSAAAIVVATTQVKDLLGLDYPGDKFILVWGQIFNHIGETKMADLFMGIVCIVGLIVLKKAKDLRFIKNRRVLHGVCWFLSTSRNLLVVVTSAAVAYYFHSNSQTTFRLTGFVKAGLPLIKPPPFSTTINNTTYTFLDMAGTLGSGIIIVPILSILQNYAIAQVYSKGQPIDTTQEMLALGICNICSSFVSSMPVSGALSRGAVNHASGVQTVFGGIYTAILVVLALTFLTPWFYFIPKAALAAVIIVAVAYMVELHLLKPIWRSKSTDIIPATTTFLLCLLTRLEIGIFIGVLINLFFLLYSIARPKINVEKVKINTTEILLITPDRSIFFPSVEYVKNTISKAAMEEDVSKTVAVIDGSFIQGADYTAAKGIKVLIKDFTSRNQRLIFTNFKPSVVKTLKGVNPEDFVYCSSLQEVVDDDYCSRL